MLQNRLASCSEGQEEIIDISISKYFKGALMPVSKYFKGHGTKVMAAMKEQYGEEKGEHVFYAKANKMKKKRTRHTMLRGE